MITCIRADNAKVKNDNTGKVRVDLIATEVPVVMPTSGADIDVFVNNVFVNDATTFVAGTTLDVPSAGVAYKYDGNQYNITSIANSASGTYAPPKATLKSQMTNPELNYLYIGSEQNMSYGHLYYNVGGEWLDGGRFGGWIDIDNELPNEGPSGKAADSGLTGVALAQKWNIADTDSTPTENSTKLVKSGGVFSAIKDIKDDIYHRININAWTSGKYIGRTNGEVATYATFACTEDYYAVYAGQTLYLHLYARDNVVCAIAFYNTAKQFVGFGTSVGDRIVTVAQDGYARFVTKVDKISTDEAYVLSLGASDKIETKGNLYAGLTTYITLSDVGETTTSKDSGTTDYLKLPQWDYNTRYNPFVSLYVMSYKSSYGYNFVKGCFYDADKTFISVFTSAPADIPNNAVYVRVSFLLTNSQFYIGCGISEDAPTYRKYRPQLADEYVPCIANNIHNSDGAKTNLVKTALQYYQNTAFGYGNTHTAFSESAEAVESDGITSADGTQSDDVCYEGAKFQIDCSGFTRLTMQCIYPEYTRHYGVDNIAPPWGYRYDEDTEYDTPQGRMTAHKQALYTYQRGLMFPVKSDYSNVEVGDMLFVANSSAMWGSIGHAQIVTNVVPLKTGGNRVTIMEATPSGTYVIKASKSTARDYRSYSGGRFPMPYADNGQVVIGTADADTVTTTADNKTIATITLDEATADKEIYTIVFKATFADSDDYAVVTGLGNSINFSDIMTYNGLHYISVVLPVDGSSGSNTVTISSNIADTVTFGGAKVYKGFHTPTMSEF